MPLYEYQCQDCGTRFELLAASRAAKPASPECPQCGGSRTIALMSACAVGPLSSGRSGTNGACSTNLGGG